MPNEVRESKITWPYTSFKTVLNFVQKLEDNQAIPPRIDRSILGGSEGQKTQVLAALKFLGLIAENGDVTPLLQALVTEPNERPRRIRQLLQKHYPEATKLAEVHATTKQLEETFAPLGGDTLRKAMTFYLHAARYAQHPLSKNFKIPSGFRASGARRRSSTGPIVITDAPGATFNPAPSPVADAKARYLDLLLERAKTADGALDEKLLDRIEKLLGYPENAQQE